MTRRITQAECMVERGRFGGWRISAVAAGYLESRLFIDYTRREALSMFCQEMNR